MTVSTSTKASGSSNTAARSRSRRQAGGAKSANLGHYLAAGLGASALGTIDCEAAVVSIDIGPSGFDIEGLNGGLGSEGDFAQISAFPIAVTGFNPTLVISRTIVEGSEGYNQIDIGITSTNTLSFAAGYNSYADPTIFGAGATIGGTVDWGGKSLFQYTNQVFGVNDVAPDIVGPGKFMGFRSFTNDGYIYGYLEVTWDSATRNFEILSGAYESVPGVAIITPVPEPGSVSLVGIAALALGAGAIRRSRKARRADSAAGDEESPRQG